MWLFTTFTNCAHTYLVQGIADQALELTAQQGHVVPHVVVLDNPRASKKGEVAFVPGRDVWWEAAISGQSTSCEPEWLDAEAPLFKVRCSET